MADIGVVHPDLMRMGGAEAVSARILDLLDDRHDITFITLEEPDFERVNSFFGTNISELDVISPDLRSHRLVNKAELLLGDGRLILLKTALLHRIVDRLGDSFEFVFSTRNEMPTTQKCIHYIHFPNYSTSRRRYMQNDSLPYEIFDNISSKISNIDRDSLEGDILLANSEWTANLFEKEYGRKPQVVFPPVEKVQTNSLEWRDREDGFIAIGRIVPDKNILKLIEIIDRLRKKGYNTHIHIIGRLSDDGYGKKVLERAQSKDYVIIEGEINRKEIFKLVSSHKFGIHGKEHEHFGMAVAEMAICGSIPFVPNSGGQVEIINKDEDLYYSSVTNCVQKIENVMNDSTLQKEIRNRLPGENELGVDRFNTEILSSI